MATSTIVTFDSSIPPEEVLHKLWTMAPDRYNPNAFPSYFSGYSSVGRAKERLEDGDAYENYYLHRPIKLDFAKYPKLDSRLYDRDAGAGAMEEVKRLLAFDVGQRKEKEEAEKFRERVDTSIKMTRGLGYDWELDAIGEAVYHSGIQVLNMFNRRLDSASPQEIRQKVADVGLDLVLTEKPTLPIIPAEKKSRMVMRDELFKFVNQQDILQPLLYEDVAGSAIRESAFGAIVRSLARRDKRLILPLSELLLAYSNDAPEEEQARIYSFLEALVSYLESMK